MKDITDYLRENGKFEGRIGKYDIKIIPYLNGVILSCDGTKYLSKDDAEFFIRDILEENHKTEVRFCEQCGKPYDMGYTAGNGEWYCCEECFEKTMDEDYGKGKWRTSDEEGEYEGWYEYLNEDGVWEDTGVFYTEWN